MGEGNGDVIDRPGRRFRCPICESMELVSIDGNGTNRDGGACAGKDALSEAHETGGSGEQEDDCKEGGFAVLVGPATGCGAMLLMD